MAEKLDSLSPSSNETRVDLGEDLLIKTAMIPGLTPSGSNDLSKTSNPLDIAAGESGSIDDLLHSAKILLDEGLVEDAKKILHQILIADANNRPALEAIEGIRKEELKQLFREESVRPRRSKPKANPRVENEEVDSEELMRRLDRDLNLGIFAHNFPTDSAANFLFQSPEEMEAFTLKLETNLVSAGIKDWIDLGIAFLEMDFYQIAVRLFSGACRKIDSEMHGEEMLSATSLLALSLTLLGRPLEAISKLQPLLRDAEIKASQKIELYYVMGRTYESLKESALAIHFYQQVMDIDARYRDVQYRIRTRK